MFCNTVPQAKQTHRAQTASLEPNFDSTSLRFERARSPFGGLVHYMHARKPCPKRAPRKRAARLSCTLDVLCLDARSGTAEFSRSFERDGLCGVAIWQFERVPDTDHGGAIV